MGAEAFAKYCMLTSSARIQKARLEARVGVGNGVPGAEGAETKTSSSQALKAPRRDAVNVQGRWNVEGFPSPTD